MRKYVKRLHVDLSGYASDYEDLMEFKPNVEDYRKIVESGTVQAEYAMQLLNVRT